MSEQEAIELAKAWLEQKHCTLWQTFNIGEDKGRTEAAEWLISTIHAFMDFMDLQ